KMMRVAKAAATQTWEEAGRNVRCPLVIAVTILTSQDYDDLAEIGVVPLFEHNGPDAIEIKKHKMEALVVSLARAAQKAGLDGAVASVHEALPIRNACGPKFRIVTPGIRPAGADKTDQKRLDTPANAIKAESDELVVGSPIYKDPNPAEAAERIVREIAEALGTHCGCEKTPA
ncbi:MAG: orotidine 5'-phosphate decarboxylase / HUMPS family protein, partial [Patescibacteria group bacterium]